MYKGIGASAGIGIGKVVVIKEQSLDYKKGDNHRRRSRKEKIKRSDRSVHR